ncbi:MAG: glycosyltransferase [Candidatus Helarchaeota archaeon]
MDTDYFKDEINRFLLKPGDTKGFKDKIIYLIENPDIRKKFSKNARKICENELSFNVIEKKTYHIFKRYKIL